jgi:sec-independent protein translocase protein TatC
MVEEKNVMSIWDHLDELRSRLIKAVIALAIATLLGFWLAPYVLKFLTVPIGGLDKLQSIEVTENIGVYMRVSLLTGFIVSLPFILYQLLSFIFPGLLGVEKKGILILLPMATIMFVGGAAFAYFVMMDTAIPFLVGFLNIPTTPRLSSYVNFVTNLIFWIGVCFELPLVAFFLAKLKLITAGMLAKQWRIAIVVIAILAAVVSPTVDPINMFIIMLPLMGLYLLSILLAFIGRR